MRSRLLAILLGLLLLTGCVRRPVSFALDDDGNYTGFARAAEGYTRQAAKLYGWVIVEDLAVTENVKIWQQFLTQAAEGREASVRIAEFFGRRCISWTSSSMRGSTGCSSPMGSTSWTSRFPSC